MFHNLLKLAILEGKTVVMVADVTQAYRMKYFLAKFSLRSFVLSTDMPKAQISSILQYLSFETMEAMMGQMKTLHLKSVQQEFLMLTMFHNQEFNNKIDALPDTYPEKKTKLKEQA